LRLVAKKVDADFETENIWDKDTISMSRFDGLIIKGKLMEMWSMDVSSTAAI